MAYNAELAHSFAKRRDRDEARFFAGRRAEIASFDDAAAEAADSRQAVFRIFQGAPGCGKTSLAAHLRKTRQDGLLHVVLDERHLESHEALAAQVEDAGRQAASHARRAAEATVRLATSYLRAAPMGEAVGGAIARRGLGKATLVLHRDEAQTLDEASRRTLLTLHTVGLGVPTVFACTGLSHTARQIRRLPGLSRLANNAVVNMERLSEDECADSTCQMLTALAVSATADERAGMARTIAPMSRRWPQHLCCAQQALCEELIRADGVLKDVDVNAVRAKADARRYEYYRERLADTVLGEWPELTQTVVTQVGRRRPSTLRGVGELCIEQIEALALNKHPLFNVHPSDFADTLVEKGVLSFTSDGCVGASIPSLAAWLRNTYPAKARDLPSAGSAPA